MHIYNNLCYWDNYYLLVNRNTDSHICIAWLKNVRRNKNITCRKLNVNKRGG